MSAPDPQDVDRVWKLMEKIGVCMFTSKEGERLRARPMGAKPRKDRHVIYFLTDERGHKDNQVAQDDHVCLSFSEPGNGKFLAVSGRARVLNDRELIRELWDTAAEAWWSSADDPLVRVIEVTPEDAQFWEGPHGIVATFAMVVAAATSAPPLMGDHREVDMH